MVWVGGHLPAALLCPHILGCQWPPACSDHKPAQNRRCSTHTCRHGVGAAACPHPHFMRLRPEQTHHTQARQRSEGRLKRGGAAISCPSLSQRYGLLSPHPLPLCPVCVGHSQAPNQFPVGAVCPGELPSGRAGGSGASPAPQLLQTGSTCRGAQTRWGTPAGPLPTASLCPRNGPIPTGKGTRHSSATRPPDTRLGKALPAREVPAVRCQCLAVSPLHTKSPAQNRPVPGLTACSRPPQRGCPRRSRGTHGRDSRYRRHPIDS